MILIANILLAVSALLIAGYYLLTTGNKHDIKFLLWLLISSVWSVQVDTTSITQSLDRIEAHVEVKQEGQ